MPVGLFADEVHFLAKGIFGKFGDFDVVDECRAGALPLNPASRVYRCDAASGAPASPGYYEPSSTSRD